MRTVVETLAVQAKAAIATSLPRKSRLPIRKRHGLRGQAWTHSLPIANDLIDNKAGIIIDAVGTRANRTVEIAITQTMVDRVERRFDLRPQRLAGDTVYGAVRLLKWLVDRNITPHVPVWDKSARSDGTFSRADFVFDQERNVYVCPGGAELTSTGNIDQVISSTTGLTKRTARPAC